MSCCRPFYQMITRCRFSLIGIFLLKEKITMVILFTCLHVYLQMVTRSVILLLAPADGECIVASGQRMVAITSEWCRIGRLSSLLTTRPAAANNPHRCSFVSSTRYRTDPHRMLAIITPLFIILLSCLLVLLTLDEDCIFAYCVNHRRKLVNNEHWDVEHYSRIYWTRGICL